MNNKENYKKKVYIAFSLIALGILIGAVCGALGTVFSFTVSFVTELRLENSWILFLLPIGGLITVLIYRMCKVTNIGTKQVVDSVHTENQIPPLLTPAIFLGTVITHLCGGSAGREGAALQLGGGIAAFFSKIFHLDDKSGKILTMCGMSAFFSAIFGTPFAACVFVLEVIVEKICVYAALPVLFSSVTAFKIANWLGTEPERFHISKVPSFSFNILWKILLIAAAGAVISMVFCYCLRYFEKLFEKLFKNAFLRIAVGGVLIVLLTLFVGTNDYNGAGVNVIERIFNDGTVGYEAFLLKIVFTAVTVAAGYKGGEIIPSLFIGAAFGGAFADLLGMNTAFGAAIGMTVLFCGVTNCPLATVILCVEMFGIKGIVFFAISSLISFLLSGNINLYGDEKYIFAKLHN